jgi:hypothetical protein
MKGNVKRAAKAPALLILASFIVVVAGLKAASFILVPEEPIFAGCSIMLRCKAPAILRNDVYLDVRTMTKDKGNAADGYF